MRHNQNSIDRRQQAHRSVKTRPQGGASAFSLIELLVVLAIMGLLAAVGLPALKGMGQSNAISAANRQLLDDVSLARARAISGRTTIYMVFVPPELSVHLPKLTTASQRQVLTNLSGGRFTSYALLALRNVGDQPGRGYPRYLSEWKKLPEGVFITPAKYQRVNPDVWRTMEPTNRPFAYYGKMGADTGLPFPTATSPRLELPYLAFNPRGQIERLPAHSARLPDEVIPLIRGSMMMQKDAQGNNTFDLPDLREVPPGNATNLFDRIHIDSVTGRARVEKQEIK